MKIVNRYKENRDISFDNVPYRLLLFKLFQIIIATKVPNDKYNKYSKWIQNKQHEIITKIDTNKFVTTYFSSSKKPLFTSIELETINRCNGTCPFCPINKNADTREFKKMDEGLFKSIIGQLKVLNYSGRLAFHSNNEPFLDKRIIEFVKYARENLPNTFLYLYTNGSLLTLDKFVDIIPHLDRLVIDNYNDNLEMNDTSKIIYDYCKLNMKNDKKVEIHLRKINEVLNTRGGQSPNNSKRKTINMSCVLPFKQIIIRPDGKLSLCCNDPLGKFTMGDLNNRSLMEIWNSKKYAAVRNKLKIGRKNISLCKYCDTLPGVKEY